MPDAWIDLPAKELKVLLELIRGSEDPALTLGSLAARSGFSSAARLAPIFERLVHYRILLWKRVDDTVSHRNALHPCYAQMDIYQQPDW